jgi:hypothetical protein
MSEKCENGYMARYIGAVHKLQVELNNRAAIQRRGSKLAWVVILSVYGADTIAIDLSLSALIS